MKDEQLTDKQKIFIKAYLANGFNATQAALTAGYSNKHTDKIASELIRKTRVRAAIDAEINRVAKKLEITFEKKLNLLWECAQDCKAGAATKEGYVNASGLVSAVAELNKMQGHYAQKDSDKDNDSRSDAVVIIPDNKRETDEGDNV